MAAFQVVQGRSVPYLDTPLDPQLESQNGLLEPGRLMGDTPDTQRPPIYPPFRHSPALSINPLSALG
jgi:hypothetical protein